MHLCMGMSERKNLIRASQPFSHIWEVEQIELGLNPTCSTSRWAASMKTFTDIFYEVFPSSGVSMTSFLQYFPQLFSWPAVTLPCSSRLQLVRIQVQIQETLIKQFSHHPSVKSAMSQLDSELMDITKVTEDNPDFQTPVFFLEREREVWYGVGKCFICLIYLFLPCSCTESLPTTSNCRSASWPSFTVPGTLIPSWCTRCGRKSWRKASQLFADCYFKKLVKI